MGGKISGWILFRWRWLGIWPIILLQWSCCQLYVTTSQLSKLFRRKWTRERGIWNIIVAFSDNSFHISCQSLLILHGQRIKTFHFEIEDLKFLKYCGNLLILHRMDQMLIICILILPARMLDRIMEYFNETNLSLLAPARPGLNIYLQTTQDRHNGGQSCCHLRCREQFQHQAEGHSPGTPGC